MKRLYARYLIIVCSIGILIAAILQSQPRHTPFTREIIESAERLIGLSFTDAKRDSMLDGLKEQLGNYESIRKVNLENSVPPAVMFNPIPIGTKFESKRKEFKESKITKVKVPKNLDDLAYYSVGELAYLIKNRKVTSEQLTKMYLDRLKKYGPKLQCVITLTETLAVEQAKRADREIAAGKYRGPLHGIPYGAKDLLATEGIPTTWGAGPYKEQIINEDAAVIKRLKEAGAILVAKLSLGELAWGDVWYGGLTRNPWNYKQGSSGSSAGPAAAVAAGLVGFAIGSETWGSIVSPSIRCGVTSLRPTYGRVSRTGAMALSWSMDKIGPMCRSVEDCALVLDAIYGPDGQDQSVHDLPFNYDHNIKLSALKIGYLKDDFDSVKQYKEHNEAAFAVLRSLGATLIPVSLPNKYPVNDLAIILSAEASAAFDEFTRSGKEDLLVRQIKKAWPNVFRLSRFIPAVEYIQANRIRYLLIQEMANLMAKVDVVLAPPFEGNNLLLTNLTGHPCVVLPNGFTKDGMPTGICFIGRLFDEGTVLAVAKVYQDATDFHLKHPKLER